ncbi:hypothetical protein KJA16_02020 [Patescibacteria group bacterium]|nr:hypothetical protein [Patescibacteria group bacterium]
MMIAKQKNQDLIESFSGIRGIYGRSINEEFAYKYAWNYCQLFRDKISSLVIGGDSRSSTPALKKAMIKAFKDWGTKKIIDIGIVPIQTSEYGVLRFKASGGVYISASHNEPEYNGWKFLKEDGALLYQNQADQLIKRAHKAWKREQKVTESKTEVINKNNEAIDKYIRYVLGKIGRRGINKIKKSKFKILVDPNGGAAIVVLEKLLRGLGVQATIVNNRLGQFGRLIEPNAESLLDLSKHIDKDKFEFGCGFDSDADRVEFVIPSNSKFAREMGQVVPGQYVLTLACDACLTDTKNQVVGTNDCTSYLLQDVIKRYEARMEEAEVGEMTVVKEMEKQKSIIGGEGSCGGVIIPPIKCRDGIMTVAMILKMIAERRKSLVDILESYPRYYSQRKKINCLPSKAIEIKNKLENYFKNKGYKIKKTGGATGGLKALIDKNSYIWFRQSKTEPITFRIIADGDGYKKVERMLREGVKLFNKFKREFC